MKNTVFTILFLFFTMLPAGARSVVFVLKDSTKVYYVVSEGKPIIKLNKKGFSVDNDSYLFSSFDRFCLTNDDTPSSVDHFLADGLRFENGAFIAETTMPVAVYTVDGKQVDVSQHRAGNHVAVDTSSLQPGIYLLRLGRETIKFVKK